MGGEAPPPERPGGFNRMHWENQLKHLRAVRDKHRYNDELMQRYIDAQEATRSARQDRDVLQGGILGGALVAGGVGMYKLRKMMQARRAAKAAQ